MTEPVDVKALAALDQAIAAARIVTRATMWEAAQGGGEPIAAQVPLQEWKRLIDAVREACSG